MGHYEFSDGFISAMVEELSANREVWDSTISTLWVIFLLLSILIINRKYVSFKNNFKNFRTFLY